ASMSGKKHAKSNPVLNLSIDGLSFYQQRYANGGNQFSIEPPDQGLCAGNGFVLESTNDVLRVFNTAGDAVVGVVSLNQFYDYPHIGADANGIYLTTNEFPLFADGYIGAQIYAMSKQALAATSANINLVQFNTADPTTNTATGLPGFTVWPAISAGPDASEFG